MAYIQSGEKKRGWNTADYLMFSSGMAFIALIAIMAGALGDSISSQGIEE